MLKISISSIKKLYIPVSIIVIALLLLQLNSRKNLSVAVNNTTGLEQVSDFFPISSYSFWEYKGIKKEQQVGGEITTTEITKKISVTKIERIDSITTIYLEGGDYPYITFSKGVFDFEPTGYPETKFTLPLTLYKGARWGDEETMKQRDDGYYVWEVEDLFPRDFGGKTYNNCYRIAYKQLSGTQYKVFCQGLGIVEEGYKHNGTVLEVKYELISTNVVD